MNRSFNIILAAQFFSSLADNALLFAAIALLKNMDAPAWQIPVLHQFFVFSFIVLAPFVGALSDAIPKGRVMFISNSIKMIGCAGMLFGLHPLFAYGFVGIGAALYSPAKYGILTECLPAHRLVWANGWMEGLTVAAIILGAIFGGLPFVLVVGSVAKGLGRHMPSSVLQQPLALGSLVRPWPLLDEPLRRLVLLEAGFVGVLLP